MQNKYLYLSLLFLCLLSSSLYFNTVLVDSQAYTLATYYVQGKNLFPEDNERVLGSYAFTRPFLIFFAAIVEPLVGVRYAYSIFNLILFITSSFLFFFYLKRIFHNNLIAYIGSILYSTSLPLIIYGTKILSDMSGYFFIIAGIYVIDVFLEKKKWYSHFFIHCFLGISLLVREYCLILVPYYLLSVFVKELSLRSILEKIKKELVWMWSIIIVPLPSILFSKLSGTMYFFSNKTSTFSWNKITALGSLKFFLVIFFSYHLLWFFSLWALYADKERKLFYWKILISTVPLIFGAYLFALLSPRMVCIMFPFVISAGAYGIYRFAEVFKDKFSQEKTILFVVCVLVAISFLGAWLYPAHTMIAEDAGGNVVIQAIINEIQHKIGGLL